MSPEPVTMNADALICSHPRSGGRWLRFLLAHYLAARHDLRLPVTPETVFAVVPDHDASVGRGYGVFRYRSHPSLPLVAVCHQPYDWQLHRGFPTIFLVRNAYDVVVSAYYNLTREKGRFSGSLGELIAHPSLGVGGWIEYINSWAPQLAVHRDATHVVYRDLDRDPASALRQVLAFLDEPVVEPLVEGAVARGAAFRSARQIRTGQEGNFWDHLQPEDIFYIQERLHEGLSELSITFLHSIGVEIDPFPRKEARS